jgi:beta-lactamase class A
MARNLSELLDVDIVGKSDKYVLMYDNATKKWTAVNPDEVLSAASTTETTQPGLPTNFVDELDVDLDDKIDLDA